MCARPVWSKKSEQARRLCEAPPCDVQLFHSLNGPQNDPAVRCCLWVQKTVFNLSYVTEPARELNGYASSMLKERLCFCAQDRRGAGAADPPEQSAMPMLVARPGCRSVRASRIALGSRRRGRSPPLLLAARQLVGLPPALAVEPDQFEGFGHQPFDGRPGLPIT